MHIKIAMADSSEKKRGLEHLDEYEPKPAKHLRSLHDRMAERRLVVILEGASLETVKVKHHSSYFGFLSCYPFLLQLKLYPWRLIYNRVTNLIIKCYLLYIFCVFEVGKTFELLNCDQHKNMIVKNGRNPGNIRPDITHQVKACMSRWILQPF